MRRRNRVLLPARSADNGAPRGEAGAWRLLERHFEHVLRIWRSLRVQVHQRRPSPPHYPAHYHRSFHMLPSHTRSRDVSTTGGQHVSRKAAAAVTALGGAHTIAIEIPRLDSTRIATNYGDICAHCHARARARACAHQRLPAGRYRARCRTCARIRRPRSWANWDGRSPAPGPPGCPATPSGSAPTRSRRA